MKLCKCGCGGIVYTPDKKGRERFFCIGHRPKGLKRSPLSEETKKKISKSNMGKKMSEESKIKMSIARKDKSAWNKGIHTGIKPWLGKKRPMLSILRKKQWADGSRKGGWKLSEETRMKLLGKHSGEKSNFWKGGINPINNTLRKSLKYRIWREKVFNRDNYTCVLCKQKGGELNADHIKRFSEYPELRFDLSNGRTLCIECHRKTPTYGNRLGELC